MNGNSIPVFLSTDNRYAVPTYVTLHSLMKNYRGKHKVKVFVLVPDSFSCVNKKLIQRLVIEYKSLDLSFIDMKGIYRSVTINNSHITTATMYRLMIPQLAQSLKISKCIYIDSDIVVEGDISELFNIDLEGFCIGGVRDTPELIEQAFDHNVSVNDLYLKNYINAGVLLINIKEINKLGLAKCLEKAGYNNDYKYNDQDAINDVFMDTIKIIPDKYNTREIHINEYQQDYRKKKRFSREKVLRDALILHYVTDRKPWQYKNNIMSAYWWKYVGMLDKDVLNDYVYPFLKANKLSPKENLRESIKATTIRIKLYDTLRTTKYTLLLIKHMMGNGMLHRFLKISNKLLR